ncbi:transcriptional regulator [Corynebacterium sp. HMSC062E11]|uniref:type 1 glutamine amidotransferase domain-containing protein n=1 Tax=Corynebacterium TaxID=1716 RepID=UPI0008A4016D|nr:MULTISPECIES: type 1 glutamine amidotransferase domain-containing protein [unclassified Corynebacterium]MDK6808160.1 type 1 glutamine amidotransferase domain-containing protein [Corynebacterium aurimucosum]NJJ84091.1 type 1 glutamine amidotransferase domain-containing protein [Corynebacterium aurimucosum]OFK27967.1 transcriptional regulator [Corynebacterium sp. HMSC062E11]OFN18206.1 transcriptional regulator [Corynebacterium sp. HMSC055A01]OFP69727.1 transcriptional regulator [Corynebacteri
MTSVLFVVSAADGWTQKDGSVHPTGYWAEELAVPHRLFSEAGWDITIATPNAVAPTLDEMSLGEGAGEPEELQEIRSYLESIKDELDNPKALADVNEEDYDVVFYPGGHGPMEDLAGDAASGALLKQRLAAGTPLALLCHAPAALLAAKNDDGTNAFAGKNVTGFSNTEEESTGLAENAKWLLESELVNAGVKYDKAAEDWSSHVVVDGNLYTGQNPQSSADLAKRILEDLGK